MIRRRAQAEAEADGIFETHPRTLDAVRDAISVLAPVFRDDDFRAAMEQAHIPSMPCAVDVLRSRIFGEALHGGTALTHSRIRFMLNQAAAAPAESVANCKRCRNASGAGEQCSLR